MGLFAKPLLERLSVTETSIDKRYRLLNKLGDGSFGTVIEGEPLQKDQIEPIKGVNTKYVCYALKNYTGLINFTDCYIL